MKLRLVVRNPFTTAAPRTVAGLPAEAWEGPFEDGAQDVEILAPFHLLFFARGRKAHEAEHVLSGLGNKMHAGHTWHFCGRSWHAFRLNWPACISAGAYRAAVLLERDGQVLEVP